MSVMRFAVINFAEQAAAENERQIFELMLSNILILFLKKFDDIEPKYS